MGFRYVVEHVKIKANFLLDLTRAIIILILLNEYYGNYCGGRGKRIYVNIFHIRKKCRSCELYRIQNSYFYINFQDKTRENVDYSKKLSK